MKCVFGLTNFSCLLLIVCAVFISFLNFSDLGLGQSGNCMPKSSILLSSLVVKFLKSSVYPQFLWGSLVSSLSEWATCSVTICLWRLHCSLFQLVLVCNFKIKLNNLSFFGRFSLQNLNILNQNPNCILLLSRKNRPNRHKQLIPKVKSFIKTCWCSGFCEGNFMRYHLGYCF